MMEIRNTKKNTKKIVIFHHKVLDQKEEKENGKHTQERKTQVKKVFFFFLDSSLFLSFVFSFSAYPEFLICDKIDSIHIEFEYCYATLLVLSKKSQN